MKTIKIAMLIGALACMTAACGAELNPKTEGHIQSALEAKGGEFRACYETALEKDRELTGDMGLKLDINEESGQVTKSEVEKSTIEDQQMKDCVAGAASDITLPEPPGVPVEGHWSLQFGFE